jgi:molecular chaperone GrpE (heat shock protein)
MTDQPDSEMGTGIAPAAKATAISELDSAGEAILKLLHKAADVADANSRQAFDTAQKLANQLREAEHQIAELQAEVQRYRDRSERAEQWLRRIYKDIEDRLVRQPDQRRRLSQRQDQ